MSFFVEQSGLPCAGAILRAAAALVLAMSLVLVPNSALRADEPLNGEAIWKFSMKSVNTGKIHRGELHVYGLTLTQTDPKTQEKRNVGRKVILGKKQSRLEFSNLSADGGNVNGINGKAVITIQRYGEWSGRMIDSNGDHWDFRCSRIKG